MLLLVICIHVIGGILGNSVSLSSCIVKIPNSIRKALYVYSLFNNLFATVNFSLLQYAHIHLGSRMN